MSHCCQEQSAAQEPNADVMRALVDNHARFLEFLEKRVGRRDIAEEILQDAFVKSLEKGASLRETESVVAWFYRMLRNALADRARRRDAESRALERAALEPIEEERALDDGIMGTVCQCVYGLLDTLKPDYAAIVRHVDVDGLPVAAFAEAEGITPNNASVRLFRAREALREQLVKCCGTCTEHGCFDCQCTRPFEASEAAAGAAD